MKIDWLLIGITISFLLVPVLANAQAISTDRPDQANTPELVPKGSLQLESGFIAEKNEEGLQDYINYSYNNTLLRFGVNENFEARFATGYLGVKTIPDHFVEQKGFGPIALGAKIRLADQKGQWPEASLVTHVTLKTGAAEFRPAYTSTDVTLAVARSFGSKLTMTFNGGIKLNEQYAEAISLYSLSAGYDVTAQLALFVEAYGSLPEAHRASHLIDAGIIYKVTPRIQFDASGGIGIKNSSTIFISTGVSTRLFK
ncbi:MAG TPA: transporter [Chryseosolibacter sp.]